MNAAIVLLNRAMSHLSNAREDIDCAADSLPPGNKAQQSVPQLDACMQCLRELAELQRVKS